MEIVQLNDKKTTLSITRDELAKILKEKFLNNDEKFQFRSYLPYNISIDFFFNYITVQTAEEIESRKQSLEKAKQIKFKDFLDEFKTTSTKLTRHSISQFYNAMMNWHKFEVIELDYVILMPKEELLKFRRVGANALDLFELFLKEKGFRFAFHDGEKLV